MLFKTPPDFSSKFKSFTSASFKVTLCPLRHLLISSTCKSSMTLGDCNINLCRFMILTNPKSKSMSRLKTGFSDFLGNMQNDKIKFYPVKIISSIFLLLNYSHIFHLLKMVYHSTIFLCNHLNEAQYLIVEILLPCVKQCFTLSFFTIILCQPIL